MVATALNNRTPDRPIRYADAGRKDWLPRFISHYRVRTRASRSMAISSESLVDPLKSVTLDQTLRAICYPLFAARCGGSQFEDVDSNQYVDFSMDFGSALFGHAPS